MRVFLDSVDIQHLWVLGGIHRYFISLVHELLLLDIQLVLYGHQAEDFNPSNGHLTRVQRMSFRGRRRLRLDKPILDLALFRRRCDIFHSLYYTCPLVTRVPRVITAWDMTHERNPKYSNNSEVRLFMSYKRDACKKANHIIAISNSTKQDIINFCGVSENKISVVYLAVDPGIQRVNDANDLRGFRSDYHLEEPYLIFVGARENYKNFVNLLKAFFLSGISKDFLLVAFGSKPEWNIEEREVLRTWGVGQENRVILAGFLENEKLINAYSAAEALVYPSLYEGFGLPVLEAMACGTPVICSSAASLPEVGGSAACYFEADDFESLVEALKSASSLKTIERVQKGIDWAGHFTWKKTAQMTKNIYESIL